MTTPHGIAVLLHHYVSPEPWPLGLTSAYLSDTSQFEFDGILRAIPEGFEVTAKGRAWIRAFLRVPYPRERTIWVDQDGNSLEAA